MQFILREVSVRLLVRLIRACEGLKVWDEQREYDSHAFFVPYTSRPDTPPRVVIHRPVGSRTGEYWEKPLTGII